MRVVSQFHNMLTIVMLLLLVRLGAVLAIIHNLHLSAHNRHNCLVSTGLSWFLTQVVI